MDIRQTGASLDLADNTDAIQKAIDTAASGETVYVPFGTFKVNAEKSVQLRNGSKLSIDGVIQAIPNSNTKSSIITANAVHDVEIILNGNILGERVGHLGTGGEWGMGISVLNSSNVAIIGNGSITQCWGDGFYVWEGHNITVLGPTFDSNRRNNMSVISVDGLTVQHATFSNAGGTDPQSGIDLEPDYTTEFIKNVDISYNRFLNNKGSHILFGFGGAPKSNFSNVHVHDNIYDNSCKPIAGVNTWYINLLYALFPKQYWMFPKDYTI